MATLRTTFDVLFSSTPVMAILRGYSGRRNCFRDPSGHAVGA